MNEEIIIHVVNRINKSTIITDPFPYIYVESIFPDNFYKSILNSLPKKELLLPASDVYGSGYTDRLVFEFTEPEMHLLAPNIREFWKDMMEWMLGEQFIMVMCRKFGTYLDHRFGELKEAPLEGHAMLARDKQNYKLGPHTDAVRKVLSLLFYLPRNNGYEYLGTSLYKPINNEFRCPGGPHHPFNKFTKIRTIDYKPNSLFVFFKTDSSFHGVEPVNGKNVERDILMYNILTNNKSVGNLSI